MGEKYAQKWIAPCLAVGLYLTVHCVVLSVMIVTVEMKRLLCQCWEVEDEVPGAGPSHICQSGRPSQTQADTDRERSSVNNVHFLITISIHLEQPNTYKQ